MHFTSLLVTALATVGGVVATPAPASQGSNPLSPIPNYPFGNGACLTDAQANFLAESFRQTLALPDRNAAGALAKVLFADSYSETSDSINILAGFPLGGPSFSNKAAFLAGLTGQPGLPGFTTLKVFHDCTNVSWQWRVTGLGTGKYPVKGFNAFVANPLTGVIQSNQLEFNSVAWGIDTGYTCQAPSGAPLKM